MIVFIFLATTLLHDTEVLPAYRPNLHYFSVATNLDLLNEVVKTFVVEPRNRSKFVASVFGWRNDPVKFEFPHNPYDSYEPEPELFTWMNELHVYTPHLGVRKVTPRPL